MVLAISLTFCDVQVEEVTVESCLYTASNNGNKVIKSFKVETVNPVDQVQGTVGTKCKQVVACDGFCLTSLGYHEQLGKDGDRLQVD